MRLPLRSAAIVAALIVSVFLAPGATDASAQPRFPIRAAFYYPWYPQTWTVGGERPHYKPSLGYYRSTDGSVIRRHIRAMKRARIEAGIASWWGRGTVTDDALPKLLRKAAGKRFHWAIYYEGEATGDPTSDQIRRDLRYLKRRAGSKPGYLRIHGRFVVFVYADGGDGCDMASRWRRANSVRAYVVLKVFPGYASCSAQPNSWHQYAPDSAESDQSPYSFSISPGFWKADEATPRLARNIVRWKRNVRHMVHAHAKWRLVTTFNEWGEGTEVESATQWASPSHIGDYLDALAVNGRTATTTAATRTAAKARTRSYPRIVAAGDIACEPGSGVSSESCRQRATSNLFVHKAYAAVLTLGDNQYEDGALSAYNDAFAKSWGRKKAKLHPVPGNHEYQTSNASGYYDYFGTAAGDPGKGYYSYNIGRWHLIALNANCGEVDGCDRGSPQLSWLRHDLAGNPRRCTLAYWHQPRFSSGLHGSDSAYRSFWQVLYRHHADIVLNGHDHDYERFAPQKPSGKRSRHGIREFVVGTGGKSHYGFETVEPRSQVRNARSFGVLRLTLRPRSYAWKFLSVSGSSFADAGTTRCR